MAIQVKAKVLSIYIRAQMAESGPPLGTVLGNLGLNATKFCKEFNEFTVGLPSYFLLKVHILINIDRSYSFLVKLPSITFFISLLKFDRTISVSGKAVIEHCITLQSVVQLALLRFPNVDLASSLPTICGSVNSSNISII